MPTKVNVVLDDDVKADLDRLDEIRTTTKPVSTTDIVRLLRRDRGRQCRSPAGVIA